MDLSKLQSEFVSAYGEAGNVDSGDFEFYFSPGRVNLIGEHIDYNGGPVFPAALTLGMAAVVKRNLSGCIRFCSGNYKGMITVDLKCKLKYDKSKGWGNFVAGVVSGLLKEGFKLTGADVFIGSDLPEGSGLSSSAALEVLAAYLLVYPFQGETVDRVWLARFCQQVENKFIGVNCGIMDQFAVALGKKGNAILLNTSTLSFEYVPVDLKKYSFVLMNTNKQRELADSKYNRRRKECDTALADIKKNGVKINSLAEAAFEELDYIKNTDNYKRAKHVFTETRRVSQAVSALKSGDIPAFGQALNDSHDSLRDDCEVTGAHLDAIVEAARAFPDCLGARMTGAGFGGCAIALVKTSEYETFRVQAGEGYFRKTGVKAEFYLAEIADGVRKLEL